VQGHRVASYTGKLQNANTLSMSMT